MASSSPLKLLQTPTSSLDGLQSRSQEVKTPRSSSRIRKKLEEKENKEDRRNVDSEDVSLPKKSKWDTPRINKSVQQSSGVKSAYSSAKQKEGQVMINSTATNKAADYKHALEAQGSKQVENFPMIKPCVIVLDDIVKSEVNVKREENSISSGSEDESLASNYSIDSKLGNEQKNVNTNFVGKAKTKIGSGEDKKHSKDYHKDFCHKCKTGGLIVCCATCTWAYHTTCVNPPLKAIPDRKWQCPRCAVEPLSIKATNILSWRWIDDQNYRTKYNSLSVKKRKYMSVPRREFFVKWLDRSYWHCSWVSEEQIGAFHPTLLRSYLKNEAIGALDDVEHEIPGDETDPLYQTYYKYGVQPEWLLIDRIIDHEAYCLKNGIVIDYMIKWRGVPYTEATWEDEVNKDIPDFKLFQEKYNEGRMVSTGKSVRQTRFDLSKDAHNLKHIHPPPIEPICDVGVKYQEQPSFIKRGLQLHKYQMDSLNWLRSSWHQKKNTILADEMGLGKTIQAITFLYSLFKEGHCKGPFLVSVPLSTVVNWQREFELWAPDMYVVTYVGTHVERFIIREREFSYTRGSVKGHKKTSRMTKAIKFDVLLTSYEMISIDLACLSSINWTVLVIDEAHRLKNINSKFFNDLREYSTGYKLLLTGTPVQNNLTELFSLLKFLLPDMFEELDCMQQDSENPHTDKEELIKNIHDMLQPHLLRRVKEDVLRDLPSKSECIVKVELTPMQRKYYKYILTKNFDGLNSKSGGHWATLMMVMVDLQKCCNHPYLFSTAMMEAPLLPSDIYETKALVEASGKLGVLEKLLRELSATGHRTLIFSHFTKMLDILEDFLNGYEYQFERIDGSITGAQRQSAIDRFNEPNSKSMVFLLSTKAGGLGINLATADTVILYDSDWNPHNDIQALSRAHRIGQKNKVMVYRFITRNSIEERMLQVATKKMALNNVVLENGKMSSNSTLTRQTLDAIIRHGTESLFQKETSENYVRDNFTDEAIKEMLDRSKVHTDLQGAEVSDLVPTVKTWSYTTGEIGDARKTEDNTDADFWTKVLGPHCDKKAESADIDLGDKKRVRKEVNYEDFYDDDKFLESLKCDDSDNDG